MSKQLLIRSAAALLIGVVVISTMALKPKGKKIILFGDSITQMGVEPGGYVDLLKKGLEPAGNTVIGAGIGGNKVYDLFLRLEDDVLAKKPDVVVIYVGVNDVWHKWSSRTGTDQDKFVRFYQALIKKIQGGGSRVVLCTPAVIGEKKPGTNEMDAELDKYAGEIRKLAAEHQLPLADLRKVFTAYDAANNPQDLEKGILTTDGVHLNAKGNQMVADTILPLIR
ncbi:G-D-S-L family lipolytic protein [Pedobacter antarcticus 4BY]|uniref:G-D-S-L family lipolytic protein n=2 Tax=Pedobacter antarcticus TaxID=34086 RepID=A0A081PGX3_9SPHI|nr:GDSL-type esterase/lipase family protein [Pedobacter antarcticus]KEQ29946.1 G-D-S-L family lipolytic protein [Pedobacter antarcticus 4BY]SFE78897.1 Lysophospholipase L1 [Pedobacter antarcticus]